MVPVTESYLSEFLVMTSREPDEVVFSMPHLNRQCTVRLAAINAALAGCRPGYFPVVLAAWESLTKEGYAGRAIWQSTTGTAPFLIVNGPVPEQLALDVAGTVSRTGALIHETISALLVLGPEHARIFGRAGWSKPDLSQFIYDHAVRSRAELASVGKDAIARQIRWRLPADHPDAMPDRAQAEGHPDVVRVLNSAGALLVAVAGANNAGVSAVIETFGPRGGPPAVVRVAD